MTHQARKRFGQHFLTDQSVLGNMLEFIMPQQNETVVEIGPGLGALTEKLTPYLKQLHVIELDRDLAEKLRSDKWLNQLVVHESDVLKFNFDQIPAPMRVVGNLPYNISSPILFKLLENINLVADQHFMLQKEVVDRIAASPNSKEFGRLSVMLQAYYDTEHLFDVPATAFLPPPKVMSAVIRMVPKNPESRNNIPFNLLQKVVTTAFSHRRKMLRNNWANVVPEETAHAAGIELTSRAESIATEQYIHVAQQLAATK